MPPNITRVRIDDGSANSAGVANVSARLVAAFGDASPATTRKPGAVYAFLICNAMSLRIATDGVVRAFNVCVLLGIDCDGAKEILGIVRPHEIADCLYERRIDHIFNVIGDNEEAAATLRAACPGSHVQGSIASVIHQSLQLAPASQRSALNGALRAIYRASTLSSALAARDALMSGRWGHRYPGIASLWSNSWMNLGDFFELPSGLRRFLETANAADSFVEKLRRKAITLPGSFPDEETALLALSSYARKCQGGWRVAPRKWQPAKAYFHGLCAAKRILP
jgi:transposase-like protein